jgi:putative intracellular protease/amidase
MTRVLMVVSSARELPVAGGTHPTGYWPEEVLKPYERFQRAGVEVVVATPDGRTPQPDPWGLEPFFHYPDDDEDFMATVVRSFARDVEDVRVTLHHLTELNLVAARRVHRALTDAGMDPEQARTKVEQRAAIAYREDRDFVDVLAEDPAVVAAVDASRLRAVADDVRREAEEEAHRVAASLDAIDALRHPVRLGDLSDDEMLAFDAVFIPGGHGPMVDLADNGDAGRVLRLFQERQKTVAALCHGPAALLSAGEGPDGAWLFDGYKLTAFTDEEEDDTKAGRQGMAWYLEDALKSAGAVFDDADAPWTSHVIVDRNLITAQNPASSEAAADAVLKRLEVL